MTSPGFFSTKNGDFNCKEPPETLMHTHNPKVGKSERKIKVKGAQIEGLPTFSFFRFIYNIIT